MDNSRRTDAIQKGDMFDFIMDNERKIIERGNYPSQIYDYPERLHKILICFFHYWKLPPLAIPNKRQKSNFALWVEQLDSLLQMIPENQIEFVMHYSHWRYVSTKGTEIIYRPLSIKRYIIDALRHANELKKVEEEKKQEQEKNAPATKKEALSILNNILDNEE